MPLKFHSRSSTGEKKKRGGKINLTCSLVSLDLIFFRVLRKRHSSAKTSLLLYNDGSTSASTLDQTFHKKKKKEEKIWRLRRNEPCLSNRSLESCIDERVPLYKSFDRGSSRFTRLEDCIFYGRNNQFRFYYHFFFFSPSKLNNAPAPPLYAIFNFLTSRQSPFYFSTGSFWHRSIISLTKYQRTAFRSVSRTLKIFRESGVKAVFIPPFPFLWPRAGFSLSFTGCCRRQPVQIYTRPRESWRGVWRGTTRRLIHYPVRGEKRRQDCCVSPLKRGTRASFRWERKKRPEIIFETRASFLGNNLDTASRNKWPTNMYTQYTRTRSGKKDRQMFPYPRDLHPASLSGFVSFRSRRNRSDPIEWK